jgi:hypothetical protein
MPFGRNMAGGGLSTLEYDSVDDLPPSALRLLGPDFFATPGWYRTVVAHALPPDTRAVFLTLSDPAGVVAVFPMMVAGRSAGALTTPYTCEWRPLLAPGLSSPEAARVWCSFGAWCARFATVRLDAMDRAVSDTIAAGVVAGGVIPLPFDHFGNWRQSVVGDWNGYLRERPGYVREVLRRRSKRLEQSGARFTVMTAATDLERGIAAFERVYATSWKTPEPFPNFNPALMRACAAQGSLRLGTIARGDDALAVQFWVVVGRWSAVLKLAHNEAAKALSPGTVLTARMIQHLMTTDGVTEIDFGRGDDPYKQSWTGTRRQRVGLVLANPLLAGGLLSISQHLGGRAIRRLRQAMRSQTRVITQT